MIDFLVVTGVTLLILWAVATYGGLVGAVTLFVLLFVFHCGYRYIKGYWYDQEPWTHSDDE